jgi:hypothetical protein
VSTRSTLWEAGFQAIRRFQDEFRDRKKGSWETMEQCLENFVPEENPALNYPRNAVKIQEERLDFDCWNRQNSSLKTAASVV